MSDSNAIREALTALMIERQAPRATTGDVVRAQAELDALLGRVAAAEERAERAERERDSLRLALDDFELARAALASGRKDTQQGALAEREVSASGRTAVPGVVEADESRPSRSASACAAGEDTQQEQTAGDET